MTTPAMITNLGTEAAMARKKIEALRKARGWSQEDLARATGALTLRTISRLENGRTIGSDATRLLLAQALGVAVDDIAWPERTDESETRDGD